MKPFKEVFETDTVISSARLLCGIVGILLIVYLLAELTPKLAEFIDRRFDVKNPPPKETAPEEYTVGDIYEGGGINKSDEKE